MELYPLEDPYLHERKDPDGAKNQIIKALPKMAKA